MDLIDSRRLRHFLAVYELGSFGQAAERLLLTQPALSKSIRQLEDELRVKLFDRTPLGVVPTVFGEALAMHAKVIQSEIRNAESQISSLRGASKGQVTVGIGPSMAANFMPAATRRLRHFRPGIELTVMEGLVDELIPALRRGEIDLAIGAWPRIAETEFITEFLFKDEILVFTCARHPLVGRRVSLNELLKYPWALPPHNQKWRHQLDEYFFSVGIQPPKPEIVSNSASFLKSMILGNDYLTFLPKQLVRQDDQEERLVPLDVDLPALCPDVTLTFRARALLSPACREFVTVLRELGAEQNGPPSASEEVNHAQA
jgi:DNA-binding transcriptional LysR family regulator